MRDRFFMRMLYGSLPLLIWAAHFFAMYILVAAQCSPAAITPEAPRRWLLALLSVLALGACAALLWRSRAVLRHTDRASLLDWAVAGGAVLSMIGIAWSSMPIMLIDGCG